MVVSSPVYSDASSSTSCSFDYNQMINSENVYNKAIEMNPELAKKGLDPGSCRTNSTSDTKSDKASVEGGDFWAGVGGRAANSYSSDYNNDITAGCSAIAIQAALTEGMSNNLNCTCQDMQSSVKNKTGSYQTITVEIDNSTFDGPVTINNKQKSNLKSKMIDFTSSKVQTELWNSVKSSINSLQKQMQDTKTNTGFTTPSAQKSLAENINSTLQSASQTLSSSTVSDVINSLVSKQGEVVTISGDTFKSTLTINDMQSTVLDFISKTVAKSVVGDIFKNKDLSEEITKSLQIQKQENEKKETDSDAFLTMSLYLVFFIIGVFLFSIKRFESFTLPHNLRSFGFWMMVLVLLLAIFLDKKEKTFWIILSVLFSLVMLLNIKTFHKEDIVFGGGIYCIIPKFTGKKKNTYIRHQTTQQQTRRHQTTHHRTTPKQKNTQHTKHTKYNEKMSLILKDHADDN